jgi:hypothetical protein
MNNDMILLIAFALTSVLMSLMYWENERLRRQIVQEYKNKQELLCLSKAFRLRLDFVGFSIGSICREIEKERKENKNAYINAERFYRQLLCSAAMTGCSDDLSVDETDKAAEQDSE